MASSAELAGRTAVVTGASGGIGAAVSRALAAAGATVWMVARGRERLEAAAADAGGHAVVADVADPAGAEAVRAAVGPGAVDILVNAAGSFDLAPVAGTSPEMFARMIAGNLTAPFLAIRALLPEMLRAGRGDVVTIGSVAGRKAFPANGAYAAAKFGVRGLHAVLDEELRGTGVRATLVEPAATDTPLWDPLDPDGRPDLPSRAAMMPPERVAETVLYIVTRPPDIRIPAIAVERS
ncbi:MAG TPA: SDR family oxidoreductase [Longimicrobiales bacterium]|nr:SDR family oxidoreductase [Longimicrobiales bacterium]